MIEALSTPRPEALPKRLARKNDVQQPQWPSSRVDWLALAEALRNELAEYGGFAMLLSKQRSAILLADNEEATRLGGQLEEQIRLISRAGYVRARKLPVYSSPAAHILREAPIAMRPLFSALLDETTRLRDVVQEQLNHNNVLMQEVFGFQTPAGGLN